MKIMFNRPTKREPWGGGTHFITGLYEYFLSMGHDVVFSLEPGISIIFMFDPRPNVGGDCVNSIYKYKLGNPECKVIQRINDTDKARPLDEPWRDRLLLYANQVADHTIFISRWIRDYYIDKGFDTSKNHTVIVNGCNKSWYFPKKEKTLNIEKINLITHHWSDNFMKGFDIYNFLDRFVESNDKFSFSYMGRYNKDYSPKNINLIDPTYGPDVGRILREADIYITAARWEACGMHHIEAARCGLPVLYHSDGGGIPEVCMNHGVEFSNTDDFEKSLEMIIDQYGNIRDKIDYNFLSSERCFKKYECEMRELL